MKTEADRILIARHLCGYVGIQFRNSTQVYSYLNSYPYIKKGHLVLVETQYGPQIGRVYAFFEADSKEAKQATAWINASLEKIERTWTSWKEMELKAIRKEIAEQRQQKEIAKRATAHKETEQRVLSMMAPLPIYGEE